MKQIKRVVHFYQLNIPNNPLIGSPEDILLKLFKAIDKLSSERKNVRYQYFGEKYVYVQSIDFDNIGKYITGKMRCIRKDLLPEIMNMEDDDVRGIETKENEGIVETTHFVIDYSKKTPILSIEFNQFGAKSQDFLLYLVHVGQVEQLLNEIEWRPVVNDNLKTFKTRMGLLSEFVVKIHRNNIPKLKDINQKVWSSLVSATEHFQSEYATLIYKFDYQQKREYKEAESIINSLIDRLSSKKEYTLLFNVLTVKAEDSEKNNLLGVFDLLIDRVKAELKVERKEKYKTILSEDMFSKMKKELLTISLRK